MSILVIAAHPDDEVLGAGGTVCKLKDAPVHIGILGEGATSRAADRSGLEDELQRLQECARRAAALMGAKSVRFAGLPDNRFDSIDLLDIVKVIEGWIDELKPEVIYTNHGGDLNIDHSLTFRAVLTASRPVVGCPVR